MKQYKNGKHTEHKTAPVSENRSAFHRAPPPVSLFQVIRIAYKYVVCTGKITNTVKDSVI